MYDEIIESYVKDAEETKTILTNFNKKKSTCKMKNFYVLLAFLLITKAPLIAVSIYCYLIKYRAKHLLPLYYTINELREVLWIKIDEF